MRQEQQKSGLKIPGKLLAIAEQSFQELWKTPKIRKNFRTIESPQKEAPPDEWLYNRTPATIVNIPEEIGRNRDARSRGSD